MNVDAILASDLHVRADTPLCRTDDYQKAQWTKLEFIANLCRENGDVPLLVGGDIGHRASWPCWLLEKFLSTFKEVTIIACLGQHDLPAHSLEALSRSGCGVLARAGQLFLGPTKLYKNKLFIRPSHFGVEPIDSVPTGYKTILLTHQMVIEEKEEWPGQVATKGHELLKKHPKYDFILSGDNHKPFVIKEEIETYRVLINPGSMMRMTAAQADHRPRVYALDLTWRQVEPIYLPIEQGVVDRAHIEVAAKRDSRMVAFIEHMKTSDSITFDFRENLLNHTKLNKTSSSVQEKIWNAFGDK